jgi:hypothetical protein
MSFGDIAQRCRNSGNSGRHNNADDLTETRATKSEETLQENGEFV